MPKKNNFLRWMPIFNDDEDVAGKIILKIMAEFIYRSIVIHFLSWTRHWHTKNCQKLNTMIIIIWMMNLRCECAQKRWINFRNVQMFIYSSRSVWKYLFVLSIISLFNVWTTALKWIHFCQYSASSILSSLGSREREKERKMHGFVYV